VSRAPSSAKVFLPLVAGSRRPFTGSTTPDVCRGRPGLDAAAPPVVRVPQARRSSPLVTPTSLPAGSDLRVLRQRRGRLRPSSPRLLGRCRRRRLCRPLVAPWRLGVGRRAADPTPVGGGTAVAASLDSSPPPRKPSIEMLPPPTAALAVGDVCPEPSTEDTLSTLETTPRRHQRRLST
jgi:hypothetical protein